MTEVLGGWMLSPLCPGSDHDDRSIARKEMFQYYHYDFEHLNSESGVFTTLLGLNV